MQIYDAVFLQRRSWVGYLNTTGNISVRFPPFCLSFLCRSNYRRSHVAVGHILKKKKKQPYPEQDMSCHPQKDVCMWKHSLSTAVVFYLDSSSVCCPDFGSLLFVQCLAWCKQNSNGGQKIIAHIITFFFFFLLIPLLFFCLFGFVFGMRSLCVLSCHFNAQPMLFVSTLTNLEPDLFFERSNWLKKNKLFFEILFGQPINGCGVFTLRHYWRRACSRSCSQTSVLSYGSITVARGSTDKQHIRE